MNLSVPIYGQRQAASVVSSRNKSATKRSGTKPEIVLARVLRTQGVRSRNIRKKLPGKPDFIFLREKVAVFCDGDFWHGKNWVQRRARLLLGWNGDYWVSKIEYNRRRDRQNTRLLKSAGWKVIRLWELDILRDPMRAAAKVIKALNT